MSSDCLSYDEFMSYKDSALDIPTELDAFVNKVKLIQLKNKKNFGMWRKNEKQKTSWLVTKKLNQNTDEQLTSNYKGILNRISDSNFSEMIEELLNLEIECTDHLQVLVNLIFQKAVMEENYTSMYAKLSSELYPKYVTNEEGDKVYFRVIFLEKCQEMFQQSIGIDTEDELKNTQLKGKFEIIGLMAFVGQLYNHGLITNTIIYNCLIELVFKVAEKKFHSIENMCKLADVVGQKFSSLCPKDYARIINELSKLLNTIESKKDKFALMDILEKKY